MVDDRPAALDRQTLKAKNEGPAHFGTADASTRGPVGCARPPRCVTRSRPDSDLLVKVVELFENRFKALTEHPTMLLGTELFRRSSVSLSGQCRIPLRGLIRSPCIHGIVDWTRP